MRRSTTALILALAGMSAARGSETPVSLVYDVVAVNRQLLLETPDGERGLQAGDSARSGDVLRTGWRARAELAVPQRAARFHLAASTRFRLAHERPGVLLDLQRGRLRAIFDPEDEGAGSRAERLVTTPSAVLAVRGTEYGVEVERDGETSVVVFDGVVEVSEIGGVGEPVTVRAGQACRVRQGRPPSAPQPHGLGPGDWDRGRGMESQARGSSQQWPGMGDRGGRSGISSRGGGSKRHGG